MAIVRNLPCPKCRETGHDTDGNHLLVFEDQGQFCPKSQYHKSGETYYKKKGDKNPVFEYDINGKVKYSREEFFELQNDGKLSDPVVRLLALSGMKEETRYAVMFDTEQQELEDHWAREVKHFNMLKTKDLVTRGIRGDIAKLYNVRIGSDDKGRTARHYYPVYDQEMKIQGAQCRNLPKDFRFGNLGRTWGKNKLFGQNTVREVCKSGTRKQELLIVGGACDAMAAQQMLCESQDGTRYEGKLYHVWSVMKGEAGLIELVNNIKAIKKFKKIIFCFDNDKAGMELSKKACRLLKDRAVVLTLPDGCNDPNQVLLDDRGQEFVDAWWKADRPQVSQIKTVAELEKEAKMPMLMGLNFPWMSVTEMTLGIRAHNLYTIGGGSGTGKTEMAKEVIQYLTDYHGELCGVIFMEEKAAFTLRVLAGKWINKKIHLPKNQHKKGHPKWDKGRDYTDKEANRAIDNLVAKGKILIAECDGDTSIDNIIALTEELRALGCKYIFIDNLTTITHDEHLSDVKGIDKSMKRLGTYVQEEPVSIFLLCHLAKPDPTRKPFEQGGQVRQSDFRGSQSIAFWSTFMLAVERNTEGSSEEKLMTYLRCVKDRLTGMNTGLSVMLRGDTKTGRILEPGSHAATAKEAAKHKKLKKKGKTLNAKKNSKGVHTTEY